MIPGHPARGAGSDHGSVCSARVEDERWRASALSDEDELSYLIRQERPLVSQSLVEILLEKRSGDGPVLERAAAERLLRRHAPWALDLQGPVEKLLRAAGDARDQQLFLAFLLRPEGVSLAELALEAGVSVAQARQVVRRAARRVSSARDRAPGPLAWVLRTLSDRLGEVTTSERATTWTAHLGAGTSPASELLLWLAGPYLPIAGRPGWLAREPVLALSRTLQSLADDGGVRRIGDLEAELAHLGIRHDQFQAWLSANGAALVHRLAVLISGRLADAVERLLDAHAKPRTLKSLSAELTRAGRAVTPVDLERATRGSRFARTRSGAVQLAAWDPQGRAGAGYDVRRRPEVAPKAASGRASRGGAEPRTTERVWLAVPVDEDALRGAEASAPAPLAEGLDLAPDSLRIYASRWGPVSLAHDGSQLVRGSVRAVALAAGARGGDTLMLGFSPSGDLLVEVRPGRADPGKRIELMPPLFPGTLTGGTA